LSAQDAEFSIVLWMLDSFFSHNTTQLLLKDMLPFNKFQIFTLTFMYIVCPFWLGRITITFTLLLGTICFLGGVFSQN
jgi:hypothetical protein